MNFRTKEYKMYIIRLYILYKLIFEFFCNILLWYHLEEFNSYNKYFKYKVLKSEVKIKYIN